jgi:hypothetical protein
MVATLAPNNLGSPKGLEYYKNMMLFLVFCVMYKNKTEVDGCKQRRI